MASLIIPRYRHAMRPLMSVLLLISPAAAAAAGSVIIAGGNWAAIDHGASCEAMTRSLQIAAKGKVQAIAGVAFAANRRPWGEFRARMGRMPRPGAAVMLRTGRQRFLLLSRANFAWSSGPLQGRAIIDALRNGGTMAVESRDASGRRFSEPYLLDGAPTAIDAAAARCAGKMQAR